MSQPGVLLLGSGDSCPEVGADSETNVTTAEMRLVATRRKGPSNNSDGGGKRSAESTATALADGGDSDVNLVIRMRTGAPAAFEQFIERFHPVLLDYGRRANVDQP